MRWVLTWKNIPDTNDKKAKNPTGGPRGQDPGLTGLRTEAPDIIRRSKHLRWRLTATSHLNTVEWRCEDRIPATGQNKRVNVMLTWNPLKTWQRSLLRHVDGASEYRLT